MPPIRNKRSLKNDGLRFLVKRRKRKFHIRNLNELTMKEKRNNIFEWQSKEPNHLETVQVKQDDWWFPAQQLYRVPACIVNVLEPGTKEHAPNPPKYIVVFVSGNCDNDAETLKTSVGSQICEAITNGVLQLPLGNYCLILVSLKRSLFNRGLTTHSLCQESPPAHQPGFPSRPNISQAALCLPKSKPTSDISTNFGPIRNHNQDADDFNDDPLADIISGQPYDQS